MSSFNPRVGGESVQFKVSETSQDYGAEMAAESRRSGLKLKPLGVSQVLLKRIFPLALGEGRPLGRARGRPSPGRS